MAWGARTRSETQRSKLTLLVGVLEGEGGGGAVLPRLGAEVVVEAGAGGHGLGVEVGGEGAVLHRDPRNQGLEMRAPAHLRRLSVKPCLRDPSQHHALNPPPELWGPPAAAWAQRAASGV